MRRMYLFLLTVFFTISSALFINSAIACTDFQVKAEDGSIVIGRSMEFTTEVQSRISVNPRGKEEYSESTDGKRELTWKNKYGYASVDVFGLEYVVVDGINEEGLSVGALWLRETQYQKVSAKEAARAVNVSRLGAWILGSFKNVFEVKEAIKGVRVWCDVVPEINIVPPLHFAIHDAQGNNIVIEFIEGNVKVYDNPIGVLTNSPTFDWHLANLRNYINLDCLDAAPMTIGGVVLKSTGDGSGMLGLPGDWTPPSRFVRTVMLVHYANSVKGAPEAVNLAGHILNSVDIPLGDIKARGEGSVGIGDYTQWVVIKDLTNRVLYVHDYDNLSLRSIDLKKLDFASGSGVKSVSISTQDNGITDILDRLR